MPCHILRDDNDGKVLFQENRGDVVVNGGFDTADNWNCGDGWTISGGQAIWTKSNGFADIYQSISPQIDCYWHKWQLTFTIVSISGGGIAAYIKGPGTNFWTIAYWSPGVKTAWWDAAGGLGNKLGFAPSYLCTQVTIDDVSLVDMDRGKILAFNS